MDQLHEVTTGYFLLVTVSAYLVGALSCYIMIDYLNDKRKR